jgi:hypothetical protein
MAYFNTEIRNLKKNSKTSDVLSQDVLAAFEVISGHLKIQFRSGRPTVWTLTVGILVPALKAL